MILRVLVCCIFGVALVLFVDWYVPLVVSVLSNAVCWCALLLFVVVCRLLLFVVRSVCCPWFVFAVVFVVVCCGVLCVVVGRCFLFVVSCFLFVGALLWFVVVVLSCVVCWSLFLVRSFLFDVCWCTVVVCCVRCVLSVVCCL